VRSSWYEREEALTLDKNLLSSCIWIYLCTNLDPGNFLFQYPKIEYSLGRIHITLVSSIFNDAQIFLATRNTLMIAMISTVIATIIGTMAALAMHRYRFPLYNISETVMYIPIVIPEVVMGISLLVFFVMIKFTLGLTTITLSHIAFNIPFVALVVRARLHGYDKAIDEAAMDLGANELTTFWRVTLPTIMPGVLSGAMLALTLSLDDYVITYFTAGPGSTTLPLRVFSMVKTAVTPEINALSAIWVLIIFILLAIGQIAQRKKA
jgi:spermidine/putrescine transport system permease protein